MPSCAAGRGRHLSPVAFQKRKVYDKVEKEMVVAKGQFDKLESNDTTPRKKVLYAFPTPTCTLD